MPVRALLSASRWAKEPIGRNTDRVNRPGQCRSAPIAIQLSDDQAATPHFGRVAEAILSPTGDHAPPAFSGHTSSHVAVSGTGWLSDPSKVIASARRENQCCSTALPSAIG